MINDWIGEVGRSPSFWFVNLVECHGPYLPPRPYDGVSAIIGLRVADEAWRYLIFDAIIRSWLRVTKVPERALARMHRLYAASLR